MCDSASPYFYSVYGEQVMYVENNGKLSLRSGNASGDCCFINIADFMIWSIANGSSHGFVNWDKRADLDCNKMVNVSDLFYWRINNGSSSYIP